MLGFGFFALGRVNDGSKCATLDSYSFVSGIMELLQKSPTTMRRRADESFCLVPFHE